MGIKEYRATGGNAALLKDYHRQSDSLAQWQINFLPYSEQIYAFDSWIKKTPVSGYMPRGYNAGFIYDGGSPHTIAHELGHGIAGLEHVFENSSSCGKTKNLMDYSAGDELCHFQWDEIQDPSRVWMKWNKDESEGEWTTDGHYYLFAYLGMLMGMEYADAEQYGTYAERPDTYVLHDEDIKNGKIILGKDEEVDLQKFIVPEGFVIKAGSFNFSNNII